MKIKVILFISTFWLLEIFSNNLSINSIKFKYIIINGKIDNPNTDSLYIRGTLNSSYKKLLFCKNGVFSDTLSMAYFNGDFFYLEDEENYIQIYLENNFNLTVNYDANNYRKSIVFKGKGSNENNYLAKKNLLNYDLRFVNYFQYFGNLNESNFLKLADSINYLKTKLFKENKLKTSQSFKYFESKTLEFEHLIFLAGYEPTHQYLSNDKNFKVSDNFPNPFKNIDTENVKLLYSPKYLEYLKCYFNAKTTKALKIDSTQDRTYIFLKRIDNGILNSRIKEQLAIDIGKNSLSYTKDLDNVYNLLSTMVYFSEDKNTIDLNYKKLKKIEKGSKSPNFKFENRDGKFFTLDSFKGKIVFIDVWATWCYPCIKEIPYLKKLQEKYIDKNILFVSICKDDEKEKWLKMIKEKNLTGIQLFAERNNEHFFDEYLIQGIPHFIIIDNSGNIIEANAPNPSKESLINELDLLLR